MKSIKFVLVVLVFAAVPAFAQVSPATAPLQVSASVAPNCTITTAPVLFGAYDPVVTNATTDLDRNGSVTVTCTRGAQNLQIDLTAGLYNANAVGTTRAMWRGAGATVNDYLSYELYTDAPGGTVWGENASGLAIANAPNLAPRTFTVYGRVPQAQDVIPGNYADTVTAEIHF